MWFITHGAWVGLWASGRDFRVFLSTKFSRYVGQASRRHEIRRNENQELLTFFLPRPHLSSVNLSLTKLRGERAFHGALYEAL